VLKEAVISRPVSTASAGFVGFQVRGRLTTGTALVVYFFRYIKELDQNCDPLRLASFADFAAFGRFTAIELNDTHFDLEIVSLPLRLIPMNIAPPAHGGANDV